MKLGISYNLFNGNELLETSLKQMRKNADYIVLVYSNYSHAGQYDDSAYKTIQELDSDLYDDIICFKPSRVRSVRYNELKKRNTGLKKCKQNGCSHFMSVDCDEFYVDSEFKRAKKIVEESDYDASYCELVNYFWSPEFQMVESKKQYVPFIYKINTRRKHKYGYKFPVVVDPTRIIPSKKVLSFNQEQLLMHHMSYVRLDEASLRSKLIHSPNVNLFIDIVEDYIDYFKRWTPDQPPLNPHQYKQKKYDMTSVKQVNPVLDIAIKFSC